LSRIIVTGGAGFIGSHVAEKLLERHHKVFVVDNLSGGYIENIPEGTYFFNSNCEDYEQMKMIFDTVQPEYVMHLAAYAAESLSHHIRRFNYTNNLMASVNMINLCILHKVKHYVQASSMSVYGANAVPFHEELPYKPEDPYACSKMCAELDLQCANKVYDLPYTVIRPHSVTGIKQNIWDFYRNVCGIWVYRVLHNQPITIFGDGSQIRAFSHILDVAMPFVDVISGAYPEFKNQTFNVGGDEPISLLNLAKIVQEVAKNDGVASVIEHHPPRIEVHTAYSSHDKLRKFYKYKSGKTIRDMIEELYLWAKTQPDRPVFTWSKNSIEILDKMPPKWEKTLK
jgi:UDP-glucose 4-epimerase